MGGSDQWGNIVAGVELAGGSRKTLFGLTTPLITTASGAKMGKTPGRGLAQRRAASPYDYWQFWRNTEDADVGRFLRLFTELPLTEIARLERLARRRDQRGEEGPGDRGDRAVHGRAAAEAAAETARACSRPAAAAIRCRK